MIKLLNEDGKMIRQKREEMKLTQKEMAKFLNLSQGMVSLMEKGKAPVSQEVKEKLNHQPNQAAQEKGKLNVQWDCY